MAILKQQRQINSHPGFGNKPAPPGATPLIGDGVVHDAVVRTLLFKAVLVHENSERTFYDLVHQQMRWLHRFPTACPTQGDDPPVPAVQLDQTPFLRGAVGLQADHCHGRRHDFAEIARIAVEFKHRLRAGGKWRAGVKDRGHDVLVKFQDEQPEKAETADSPAERAPNVRAHEPVDRHGIVAVSEFLMKLYLAKRSGSPNQSQRTKTDSKKQGTFTEKKQRPRAAEFRQHQRTHQPGDARHVLFMTSDKSLMPHVFQQGIVHHLNGPDEPDKRPGDGEVNDQQGCHALGKILPRRHASLQ